MQNGTQEHAKGRGGNDFTKNKSGREVPNPCTTKKNRKRATKGKKIGGGHEQKPNERE